MGKWAKIFILGGSIGVLVVPLLGKQANAGLKGYFPVIIGTPGSYKASGSMGSARNGPGTLAYIECDVLSFNQSLGSLTPPLLTCAARDNAGQTYACTTYDTTLVEAARGLTENAYLEFKGNSSGQCNSLEIAVSSDNEPKAP